MRPFVFIFCLIMGLFGCSPSRVTLVPQQDLQQAEKVRQQTLLVFAIDTLTYVKEIHLTGEKSLTITSKPYQIISLPPGEYEISKLDFGHGHIEFDETRFPEIWKFDVKPGVLNYVGHFHLKYLGHNYYRFYLFNKSSAVLEYLEENQPLLLKNTVLNYGGKDRDDFLSYASALEVDKDKEQDNNE